MSRPNVTTRKSLAPAVPLLALALTLGACSGGSGGNDESAAAKAKPTNCTNKVVHPDAP